MIKVSKAIIIKCNIGRQFVASCLTRKKAALMMIIALLLIIDISGCVKSSSVNIPTDRKDVSDVLKQSNGSSSLRCYGNSMGNIIEKGFLTKQGDMVVSGVNYRIDVINEKTGQKTTISDDMPMCLNLINNTIYYINVRPPANWEIYKINIDGSDRQKITNEKTECMIVIDDWIYYSIVKRATDYTVYSIFRIKNDGSQKSMLCSSRVKGHKDAIWGRFFIYNDWIYYTNIGDEYKLYKTKIDGSKKIKVTDEVFVDQAMENQIFIDDDWIYYIQKNDHNKVFKMKIDGSDRRLVIDEPVNDVYVVNNEIIFIAENSNYHLYKIKTDGKGRARLLDKPVSFLEVLGDWIYCQDQNFETKKYKINMDDPSNYYVLEDSFAEWKLDH